MNFDNYECDNQMTIYDYINIKYCGDCKYFLGDRDCSKDYYKLPNKDSKEFILKGEKNE